MLPPDVTSTYLFFFFNDTATTEIYTLSLHDALPIYGQAAPCYHQSQHASPLGETLVRDARVCQERQGRLLLPKRAEVQDEVRDVRLQRRGEPRRRRRVAHRLRAEGVDRRRRGKDRRAREESGELGLISPLGPA